MGRNPGSKSKYNLRKRKKNESDDDDWEDEDSDIMEMDDKEYKKFLHKLFPSKHMAKKIKEMDEIDKKMDEDESDSNEESEEDDSDEEMGNQKLNIIFTIGDIAGFDEDEYEDESEEESEEDEEAEPDEMECESDEEEEKNMTKEDLAILEQFIATTDALAKKHKDSSLVKSFQEMGNKKKKIYEKQREMETSKVRKKNTTRFKKALTNKKSVNDISFFRKMEPEKQEKLIKELELVNSEVSVDKPYRLQLLEASIPPKFKACAMKKINNLRNMEGGGGEYYKIKNWVDTFMQIPFGKYKTLPVSLNDGVEVSHDFMEKSKTILNNAVYGLNDAKMQIMQMVGQWITNPSAVGSAIAIKGPPGTGKTTLVKEGISKILNRDFAFIALGGATDSSFLEGHGYTYEGSTWGKIVDILIQTKCMNPVIYFDELDKISETPKGEEIAGILTHLTDATQNSEFHDKYFSEIAFDLSKCLFIFSYNDESKINPILKDRMYRIQTAGYDKKQKATIARNYMLPKIREQICFKEEDIIIPDDMLNYIISTYTGEEKGVRNLKRCLEIIHTKLNLYRLMKPGVNLFEEDLTLKVDFPLTLTREIIDKLVKMQDDGNKHMHSIYT